MRPERPPPAPSPGAGQDQEVRSEERATVLIITTLMVHGAADRLSQVWTAARCTIQSPLRSRRSSPSSMMSQISPCRTCTRSMVSVLCRPRTCAPGWMVNEVHRAPWSGTAPRPHSATCPCSGRGGLSSITHSTVASIPCGRDEPLRGATGPSDSTVPNPSRPVVATTRRTACVVASWSSSINVSLSRTGHLPGHDVGDVAGVAAVELLARAEVQRLEGGGGAYRPSSSPLARCRAYAPRWTRSMCGHNVLPATAAAISACAACTSARSVS
jgi:hypothetical protein